MIEDDLYAYLKTEIGALVGDRIFYHRAPLTNGKAPPVPFLVYQLMDRDLGLDVSGNTGLIDSTFAFDVCDSTFAGAGEIARAIRVAMKAWDEPLGTFHVEESDFLDDDVEPALPRSSQQWRVVHRDDD